MTRKRIAWLVAGVGSVVVLLLLGRRAAGYIPVFAGWVESLGALGPLAFIAGYILATVAMVPGLLLTLAGGALFGLVRSMAMLGRGAEARPHADELLAAKLHRDVDSAGAGVDGVLDELLDH